MIWFAIGLAAAVHLATRPDDGGKSWQAVQERGVLRVGMDASFPPFEVVGADGSAYGLDVDLARAIAEGLALELQVVNIAFDGLYDALAGGTVDVLVSALPYEAQRTQDVRYSPTYFVDGLVWVYAAGSAQFDPDSPGETKVMAEAGSEASMLLRHRWPDLMVVEAASEVEVLASLGTTATAGVVTRVSACAANGQYALVIGPHLTQAPYVVAVSARAKALADRIMSSMDNVVESAEWIEIRQRWLGDAC